MGGYQSFVQVGDTFWARVPEAVVIIYDIPNLRLVTGFPRCAALVWAPLVVLALPQAATMLLSVSKMLGEGMAMAEKMLEKVAAGDLSLVELEEKVRREMYVRTR